MDQTNFNPADAKAKEIADKVNARTTTRSRLEWRNKKPVFLFT